jgi:hypothetical protein
MGQQTTRDLSGEKKQTKIASYVCLEYEIFFQILISMKYVFYFDFTIIAGISKNIFTSKLHLWKFSMLQ